MFDCIITAFWLMYDASAVIHSIKWYTLDCSCIVYDDVRICMRLMNFPPLTNCGIQNMWKHSLVAVDFVIIQLSLIPYCFQCFFRKIAVLRYLKTILAFCIVSIHCCLLLSSRSFYLLPHYTCLIHLLFMFPHIFLFVIGEASAYKFIEKAFNTLISNILRHFRKIYLLFVLFFTSNVQVWCLLLFRWFLPGNVLAIYYTQLDRNWAFLLSQNKVKHQHHTIFLSSLRVIFWYSGFFLRFLFRFWFSFFLFFSLLLWRIVLFLPRSSTIFAVSSTFSFSRYLSFLFICGFTFGFTSLLPGISVFSFHFLRSFVMLSLPPSLLLLPCHFHFLLSPYFLLIQYSCFLHHLMPPLPHSHQCFVPRHSIQFDYLPSLY